MAPALAELTAHARTLTSAGDLAGARAVLADVLDPADADPQRASPDLALAAALQARILIALGDPHAARLWAGFAHAAEDHLHGPHDERTIAAAATHAAVLQRVGNHGRAAQLYHDLVGELTAADGPLSARVLAAEADLATAEHSAGQCTAARARLADARARHNQEFGEDAPAGIKMLARLGAMERECGRTADAQRHLAEAQELCARYLPPDHPLAQQVARLAGAPATGRHVCGRVQRSAGPTSGGPAAGVTRVPATTPSTHHPVRREPQAPGDLTGRHARPEPPLTLPLPTSAAPVVPRQNRHPQTPPIYAPADRAPDQRQDLPAQQPMYAPVGHAAAQAANPPAGPDQAALEEHPADQITPQQAAYDQAAATYAPPQEQAPPGQTAPGQTAPGQTAPGQGAPGHAAPGHAAPPQAWSVDPPGPWPPDSLPPTATPPDAYPPGPQILRHPDGRAAETDRRLPVPVERPDPHSSRQPLILAAALVAGMAAAAAIVVLTLPNDDDGDENSAAAPPAATATTAAPSPSAAAPPSNAAVAPTSLALKDNRDSVSLTWRYPKGSEGPVLISGGRVGQEQRAFQQLPAGTVDYVVYGLNKQNNYCFTVAVVYTVDQVAASKAVCTARK